MTREEPILFQADGNRLLGLLHRAIPLPESVGVVHGTGFIFKNAEAVSGKVCKVEVPGLRFDWPHKAGFFTRVSYSN